MPSTSRQASKVAKPTAVISCGEESAVQEKVALASFFTLDLNASGAALSLNIG